MENPTHTHRQGELNGKRNNHKKMDLSQENGTITLPDTDRANSLGNGIITRKGLVTEASQFDSQTQAA